MGRVLYAINARKNASAALDSYRAALQLDRASLHNEDFASELWPLVDNPSLRVRASEIAVELLGEAGHDRLVAWVNVQKAPLPYIQRHAATDHLDKAGHRDRINAPLQLALDLWQARDANDPCAAFGAALTASEEAPDSYLAGTLGAVTVPTTADGEPCAGHEQQLEALRADYARRYAGLDSRVPAAFARRKTATPAKSKKRRRRR